MQDDEVRKLPSEIAAAVDMGVEMWQQGDCREVHCGCVSEWVKKELAPVLTAFRDQVRREESEWWLNYLDRRHSGCACAMCKHVKELEREG